MVRTVQGTNSPRTILSVTDAQEAGHKGKQTSVMKCRTTDGIQSLLRLLWGCVPCRGWDRYIDDLGWPWTRWRTAAIVFKYLNYHGSGYIRHRDMMFGSRVGFWGSSHLMVQLPNVKNPRWRLTLDSWCVPRGLNTCTAVARNPCVSWAFLLFFSWLLLHLCCAALQNAFWQEDKKSVGTLSVTCVSS